MILYYTQNSPFARIARVAVREGGLTGRVEERIAVLRKPENPVLATSPLGRVPTLVDGDVTIVDSRNVFTYLAAASADPRLRNRPDDWRALAWDGLVVGFFDGVATLRRELNREPALRSQAVLDNERTRAARCLAKFEADAKAGRLPDFPGFAGVALAAALGFAEFTGALGEKLAVSHPALAEWYRQQAARPSMVETAPVPA